MESHKKHLDIFLWECMLGYSKKILTEEGGEEGLRAYSYEKDPWSF